MKSFSNKTKVQLIYDFLPVKKKQKLHKEISCVQFLIEKRKNYFTNRVCVIVPFSKTKLIT
jgi:hypothetical protein